MLYCIWYSLIPYVSCNASYGISLDNSQMKLDKFLHDILVVQSRYCMTLRCQKDEYLRCLPFYIAVLFVVNKFQHSQCSGVVYPVLKTGFSCHVHENVVIDLMLFCLMFAVSRKGTWNRGFEDDETNQNSFRS